MRLLRDETDGDGKRAAKTPPLTDAQRALAERYLALKYRPLSWRRRGLLVIVAVVTAVVGVATLVAGPGGVGWQHRPPKPSVAAQRCAPGQTVGCVGGMATVIVTPPAAGASAPR